MATMVFCDLRPESFRSITLCLGNGSVRFCRPMDSEVSVIIDRYFTFADSFKPNFLNLKLKFMSEKPSRFVLQNNQAYFILTYRIN